MHSENETQRRADQITSLLNNSPEGIGFSAEDFDQIARLENLREHLDKIDEGTYLDNFMSSVNWLLVLAHVVLRPDIEPRTKSILDIEEARIQSMLEPIMTRYGAAYTARYQIEACGSDPIGLELVHRYGELKRYIRKLIERDIPGVDPDQILKLA